MVPLQPAACMLADLSRSQDATAGDGTTTVFVLTGSLLRHTHSLLSAGSPLAVDAALAVVDLAHPDILDLRGGGGEADAALASSDRKKIRGLDSFSSLEVCRGGERGCGCGLDILGCRGGRARQLVGEVRKVEVRRAALDVEHGDVVRARGHLGSGEGGG
uniref:Uncharacterized protein n=1 Tax=Oryza nivara TaxID=4536 RepID=A0A0E0GY28_ORYNI